VAKILKLDGALAASPASCAVPRRLAGEVYEAAQRARDILSAAEAEAQRIRSEAEADRERMRAEAAEVGRQEGLAQVTQLVARAALERDRLLASAEAELVRLSLSVAEKILRREVARQTPVVEIAASALEEARQRRVVVLRVHPEDASALRACERQLVAILSQAPGLDLREDPGVSRGGVVVQTEGGTIDAQLDTQLQALRSALEEVLPA
jgi:type III secretion protein L